MPAAGRSPIATAFAGLLAALLAGGVLLASGPASAAAPVRPRDALARVAPVPPGGAYVLRGRLRAAGRPAAGVAVEVFQRTARGRRVLVGLTRTGPRGTFTFRHPAGHRVLVQVRSAATPSYRAGWSHGRWVRTELPLGVRAVRLAARLRGRPYAWGAAGPRAFDCSGLTMYVFGRLGVRLPHDAAAQYTRTRHVPRNRKQLGDLIFFYGPGGIYHVGIYAGRGRIWHAPQPGGVVSLAPIWTSAYLVGQVR